MTKEDIIKLAREAGFRDTTTPVVALGVSWEQVQRFAALVAAAARAEENEACAKFIEHDYVRQFERPWRDDLSAAIRARGNI